MRSTRRSPLAWTPMELCEPRLLLSASPASVEAPYALVDTGQVECYDASGAISPPAEGEAFFGQDAQYAGAEPHYLDNGDGTVSDLVTGLMWTQSPETNDDGVLDADDKLGFDEAMAYVDTLNAANHLGYGDWRLPSIKELYSLIDFSGLDPSGPTPQTLVPFLDTDYFDFAYGDESAGERLIDAQWWSSTEYVSTTMNGDPTTFGVNFADGRIKGYPQETAAGVKRNFAFYCRGNPDYGINQFIDNGDGTITDQATGLMWMQADSGTGLNWQAALNYAEDLEFAGYDDWHLPNAKELQSLVDYTRSPATTGSPAIDPLFDCTPITDEGGGANWGFYWTGTTHARPDAGDAAAYVAFGEGLGWMQDPRTGEYSLMDVHGAGCQRSDPKTGNPDDYPYGHGPQGDVRRIYNFARAVRYVGIDGEAPTVASASPSAVGSGGVLASDVGVDALTLTFSEALAPSAAAAESYELREAGPNETFDDADDTVLAVTPGYVAGGTTVTLNIDSGNLPAGTYRLTASASALTDEAGNALDGDADGRPGGDFATTFHVADPGDTDLDGDVDLVDFGRLATHYGQPGEWTWADGDTDDDGDVDLVDFGRLASYYTPASSAESPESVATTAGDPTTPTPEVAEDGQTPLDDPTPEDPGDGAALEAYQRAGRRRGRRTFEADSSPAPRGPNGGEILPADPAHLPGDPTGIQPGQVEQGPRGTAGAGGRDARPARSANRTAQRRPRRSRLETRTGDDSDRLADVLFEASPIDPLLA